MTAVKIPAAGTAQVHVLHEGYIGLDGDGERVSGTVTLIIDDPAVIVADPGMAAERFGTVIIPGPGAPVRPATSA